MIYTKAVVVHAIYNSTVDKFFIWKHLVPNIHLEILDFDIQVFKIFRLFQTETHPTSNL
jgi:hypothetical protein